eukprot:1000212-Prorocentrum_minimum.AAC.2
MLRSRIESRFRALVDDKDISMIFMLECPRVRPVIQGRVESRAYERLERPCILHRSRRCGGQSGAGGRAVGRTVLSGALHRGQP